MIFSLARLAVLHFSIQSEIVTIRHWILQSWPDQLKISFTGCATERRNVH